MRQHGCLRAMRAGASIDYTHTPDDGVGQAVECKLHQRLLVTHSHNSNAVQSERECRSESAHTWKPTAMKCKNKQCSKERGPRTMATTRELLMARSVSMVANTPTPPCTSPMMDRKNTSVTAEYSCRGEIGQLTSRAFIVCTTHHHTSTTGSNTGANSIPYSQKTTTARLWAATRASNRATDTAVVRHGDSDVLGLIIAGHDSPATRAGRAEAGTASSVDAVADSTLSLDSGNQNNASGPTHVHRRPCEFKPSVKRPPVRRFLPTKTPSRCLRPQAIAYDAIEADALLLRWGGGGGSR